LHIVGALVAGVIVTGCQSDNASPNYGAPSPNLTAANPETGQPVIMPASDAFGRNNTSTETKSWTSADGTQHTKTATTTTSLSIDTNAANAATGVASNSANYVGKWKLNAANRDCSMTLRTPVAGRGMASTFGCFGTDLSKVTNWTLRGYEVVLTGFGNTYATMRVTQPNRMDGKLSEGKAIVAWR
jgi:hypothetical protein